MGLLTRLREAVSATAEPQLQRGQADDQLRERDFTTEQRVALAKKGRAIPVRNDNGEIVGGRYPIETAEDVENAVHDVGRSGGGAEEKAHIIKVAGQIGATSKLPDGWKAKESVPFRVLVREAITKAGSAFEATVIREGPGNPGDRNYYTKQALKEAVAAGKFEGLQCYANHPTASEERDRPERDVRQLVGHFREARYIDGPTAEVRAKFVPITGAGYEWVTSLIESALQAPEGKPLIGISIDGYGHAPDQQDINGHTYNMVREVRHLGSADIVTRAGAGGQFHRRLQEAWRNTNPAEQRPGNTSEEDSMKLKPAQMQDGIKAAVAKLEEAAGLDEKESDKADKLVEEALTSLRETAGAEIEPEIKIQEKIVEKPVAADKDADLDKLTARIREVETERDTAIKQAKDEKKGRRDAEARLAEGEKAKLAAKVLREAEVPAKTARSWFDDVVQEEDEQAMRSLVERKVAEREELLDEFRESYGVEGNPARLPSGTGTATGSGGLLGQLGINADDYVAAA